MKITVNDICVTLFEGACVRNAIMRASLAEKKSFMTAGDVIVRDSYGQELDLDAPLHDGQHITCEPCETPSIEDEL